MGGEGSGRRPGTGSIVNNLLGVQPVNPIVNNSQFEIPNYSGINQGAKKTTSWTEGSVVFVGSNGDFTQDNSNLFWDDPNNLLGIGTNAPTTKVHLYSNNSSTTPQLRVEQDGTGDASIEFLLSLTRAWVVGIDNSDSDKLKISPVSDGFSTTPAITIDVSGGVGIGTASATGNLEVSTPGNTFVNIIGDNDNNGGTTLSYINYGFNSLSNPTIKGSMGYSEVTSCTTFSNGAITNNHVNIDSNGRLGIGTTTPGNLLHVSGSDDNVRARIVNTTSSTNRWPGVDIENYTNGFNSGLPVVIGTNRRGTSASPAVLQNGDAMFGLRANSYDGSSASWTGSLTFTATETHSSTSGGTSFSVGTTPNGSRSTSTRLFIDHDGEIGIGTTSPSFLVHLNGASQIGLSTSGALQLGAVSTTTPTITLSGGIFVSGGGLWFKGYSGTYTNLAVA